MTVESIFSNFIIPRLKQFQSRVAIEQRLDFHLFAQYLKLELVTHRPENWSCIRLFPFCSKTNLKLKEMTLRQVAKESDQLCIRNVWTLIIFWPNVAFPVAKSPSRFFFLTHAFCRKYIIPQGMTRVGGVGV